MVMAKQRPSFHVSPWRINHRYGPGKHVLLVPRRRWNDDLLYWTLFEAFLMAPSGDSKPLGEVKILQRGSQTTELPEHFEELSADYCSLGQSLSYYHEMVELRALGRAILRGLRDIALGGEDMERAFRDEPGLQASLLRFTAAQNALHDGRKLLSVGSGERPSQQLAFHFEFKIKGFHRPHQIDLSFADEHRDLGRMNVLVGKNGTGKTRLLAELARALCGLERHRSRLEPVPENIGPVLAVSYSAFDTFRRPHTVEGKQKLHGTYHYCGLRHPRWRGRLDLEHAFQDFAEALDRIRDRGRWNAWLRMLDTSGVLETEQHLEPLRQGSTDALLDQIKKLGAGHKLILFVLANLVAWIEPRGIVLFDEPELHLHPNLLTALMRALHQLLQEFSSYAILATHSPIVLQEIPAKRVRILTRQGGIPVIRRYPEECFGASLNDIVRLVFGLDQEHQNYVWVLERLRTNMNVASIRSALDENLPLGVELLLEETDED
jgi:predicted ATPase